MTSVWQNKTLFLVGLLIISMQCQILPRSVSTQVFEAGQYYVGLDQQAINTQITRVSINGPKFNVVNGCNIISATYVATSSGAISFDNFVRTTNVCAQDDDQTYFSAFTSSSRIQLSDGCTAAFFNSANVQTARISFSGGCSSSNPIIDVDPPTTDPEQETEVESDPSSPTVPVENLTFMGGWYYAGLGQKAINKKLARLSLNGNKINVINGCNTNSALYSATTAKSFSITSSFIKTPRICLVDDDYLYVQALTSSTSFSVGADGCSVNLFNSAGASTIKLKFAGGCSPAYPIVNFK